MPKAKYEGIYHSIQKRIEAQDYPYQSLLPSEIGRASCRERV